ncbi:nitroreductase family deazaflavin-dependent oxidoreductase [Nocardioides marmoriginsengisoli]|uniref:Nitroreductase family deazaflavin-dependent oxidoreductase n=1 Tax=Nocardioides marmoriginsengisoli TaxID=661483 RepID=A0A3N0CGW3_9ACTN|nr:nitroreductase family deazaflavin-dependent oxidoreductase [Nocardioides marmoriginsengisoli]RNL62559.1 nitroreductase family deazaflavin-dependent oxidoreductase [Nocardioides marmoriginsengisoli]
MAEIPDEFWGNRDGALARIGTRVASTRPGSWTIRKLMPLDRRLMLRSDGRRTILGPVGAPTLLLETLGRKSGQVRVSPLLFARDGGSAIVVGSNFGQQHHPAWTGNLLASPETAIVVRGQRIPVRAELLAGEEAEAAYQRMVAVTSVYASYRGRTDREIRVFRLTPVE